MARIPLTRLRLRVRQQDFDSTLTYANASDPWLKRMLIRSIEDGTGRKMLLEKYYEIKAEGYKPDEMWLSVLKKLKIGTEFRGFDIDKIPKEGPLIMVANHPFGVLDGIILCHLAERSRPSYKVLINQVICEFPELEPYALPIDFGGTKSALETNLKSRNKAIECVKNGECLVIFPGGTVSTAPKPFADARDPSWKTFTAGLIQKTHATVIPVFFSGENSRLFQIVSQYSMTLRLSLLLWELRNKMGDTITSVVGEPLTWEYLKQFNKRDALMDFLRTHVYSLSPVQLSNVSPVELKV